MEEKESNKKERPTVFLAKPVAVTKRCQTGMKTIETDSSNYIYANDYNTFKSISKFANIQRKRKGVYLPITYCEKNNSR